ARSSAFTSGSLTNSSTGSTNGGSGAVRCDATEADTRRLECGNSVNPRASAPSFAASSASSTFVIPQILIRVIATPSAKPQAACTRRRAGLQFHIFLKGLKPMKPAKTAPPVQLEKVEDDFVELWNNMASLWGISPTMARIHGLLYLTGASLSMDDIMARLEISRGNVSMNLSKLVEWGLVRRVHKRGDRRE